MGFGQADTGQLPSDATVFELDAFVVDDIRDSIIQRMDIKRYSLQMVDSIVAEDFGKFPDNNLVEALQRVSGVQTTNRGGDEVSMVSIRGLPDVTDIGYGTASGGNPDLAATESKNYDLSLEWYFLDSSAVFATLFRWDIDGLVVDFRRRVTYEDYDYVLSAPDSASNGKLEGIELGFVFFPELLRGFGVQASYTILDSIQDIPITNTAGEVVGTDTTPFFGVSDSSYSVVLAYENPRFSARLSYVWREDFLNNYEAALFANPLWVYRKPEQSLDLSLSFNVNRNLTLTLDATNLTDEVFQSYYEFPDTHNFGSSIYSRTVAIGARYSF